MCIGVDARIESSLGCGKFIGFRDGVSWFHFDGEKGARPLSVSELGIDLKRLKSNSVATEAENGHDTSTSINAADGKLDVPTSLSWFKRACSMSVQEMKEVIDVSERASLRARQPSSALTPGQLAAAATQHEELELELDVLSARYALLCALNSSIETLLFLCGRAGSRTHSLLSALAALLWPSTKQKMLLRLSEKLYLDAAAMSSSIDAPALLPTFSIDRRLRSPSLVEQILEKMVRLDLNMLSRIAVASDSVAQTSGNDGSSYSMNSIGPAPQQQQQQPQRRRLRAFNVSYIDEKAVSDPSAAFACVTRQLVEELRSRSLGLFVCPTLYYLLRLPLSHTCMCIWCYSKRRRESRMGLSRSRSGAAAHRAPVICALRHSAAAASS